MRNAKLISLRPPHSWRKTLVTQPWFRVCWTTVRALQQERVIQAEQRHYERFALDKGLAVLEGSDLKAALQKRLRIRGLRPVPRAQGKLRIIYASHLSNNPWEPHQILPALKHFGHVIVYSLDEHGHQGFGCLEKRS